MNNVLIEIKGKCVELHGKNFSVELSKEQVGLMAKRLGLIGEKKKTKNNVSLNAWSTLKHLTEKDIDDIIELYTLGGTTQRELGEVYKIHQKYVSDILREPRNVTLRKIGALNSKRKLDMS